MDGLNTKYWLLGLFLANVIVAFLHFSDSIFYPQIYPEPAGTTAASIIRYGLIMLAVGILGFLLYIKNKQILSFFAFYVYCLMSVIVLGHYLPVSMQKMHGSFAAIPFKVHFFIFLEAGTALILLAFVARLHWKSFILQDKKV